MKHIIITIFTLLLALGAYAADNVVIVDKPRCLLYVVNGSDTIFTAPVCVGQNKGQKQRRGDHRTPEGTFTIGQIQDASWWTHDFGDGKGQRKGAYGPWFFRLKMPKWTSIGIHGTCFPQSVGKRQSEGCVRLRNEDLLRLKPLIKLGTKVIILPD